jgi:hypothetical protein
MRIELLGLPRRGFRPVNRNALLTQSDDHRPGRKGETYAPIATDQPAQGLDRYLIEEERFMIADGVRAGDSR